MHYGALPARQENALINQLCYIGSPLITGIKALHFGAKQYHTPEGKKKK